jgi:hypothetical protein
MACGVTTTRIFRLPVSIPTCAPDAGTRNCQELGHFCGGYGDRGTECHLLALEDGDARLGAEVLLAVPREIDLTGDWVIGRDEQLNVFLGHDWYVFSLDSLC